MFIGQWNMKHLFTKDCVIYNGRYLVRNKIEIVIYEVG